jgi:hypothetical protein
MDGDVGSFRVHLQSLKDLAVRLREQLEVVQRPTRAVEVLYQPPNLPLGAFAEGFSLSDYHSDVAQQLAVVVEKVGRSLDFARSVTELVAQRYEALNAGGAQNIGAVGDLIPPTPALSLPTPQVWTSPPVPRTPLPRTLLTTPPAPQSPSEPATGVAAAPAGSRATPQVLAQVTVPVPPDGGTVYYFNGSTTVPLTVTVQPQDE